MIVQKPENLIFCRGIHDIFVQRIHPVKECMDCRGKESLTEFETNETE